MIVAIDVEVIRLVRYEPIGEYVSARLREFAATTDVIRAMSASGCHSEP